MRTRAVSKNTYRQIDQSLTLFRKVISYRDDKLFTEFLPNGYQQTTLSCVDDCYFDSVMNAKFHLGMLITLMDDFADQPQYFKPLLLSEIYKLPFSRQTINEDKLNKEELSILHLAASLHEQIYINIHNLPYYHQFSSLYEFDLLRVYQANQFSALITCNLNIIHSSELIELRPFNMGMVVAGMIDIFASSQFDLSELGIARSIFHLGQRYGSICNNLTTFSRELIEGDVTNEIIAKGIERRLFTKDDLQTLSYEQLFFKAKSIIHEMQAEQATIIDQIKEHEIHSFYVKYYVDGLIQLKLSHENMQGVI